MRTCCLIVMLSVLLLTAFIPEYVRADKKLQIPLYSHQGCSTTSGKSKVLPEYPHIGGELSFQYFTDSDDAWGEVHKCNLEVTKMQNSCVLASQPSEHLPPNMKQNCLNQYQAEIPRCSSHYERQKTTCDLLKHKTEHTTDKRSEVDNVAGRKPERGTSKASEWEELEPSDKLAPGWEELTTEVKYDEDATGVSTGESTGDGSTRGKTSRPDLINNMMSKHRDSAVKNRGTRVRDKGQYNQQNLPLSQAAVQQGYANLFQDIQSLVNKGRSQSGAAPRPRVSGSGNGNARCNSVADQIAANMGSTFQDGSGSFGACAAGREQLRMLTYAKDNLARHGCYSGEYDQVISETQIYITRTCGN